MALDNTNAFPDRVWETSVTTGTGAITLAGAVIGGFQTLNNAVGTGVSISYFLVHKTDGTWERGEGSLSDATTFVRDSVENNSSGAAAAVDFAAGGLLFYATVHGGSLSWATKTETLTNKTFGAPVLIEHLAVSNDEQTLRLTVDAAGFENIEGIQLNYDTGVKSSAFNVTANRVVFDRTDSLGGFHTAFNATATAGLGTVFGLVGGVGVSPVGQLSGTLAFMDSALVNAVDATADFADEGTSTEVFSIVNDTITVGLDSTFTQLEIVLGVNGSKDSSITFEISTGIGTWTTFSPSLDSTNGLQNTGNIGWPTSAVAAWATGLAGEYLVRLTRTRNGNYTFPEIRCVESSTPVFYQWDQDGAITALSYSLTGGSISTVSATDILIAAVDDVKIATGAQTSAYWHFNQSGNLYPDGAWAGSVDIGNTGQKIRHLYAAGTLFAENATLSSASSPALIVTDTTNSVTTRIISTDTDGRIGTTSNHGLDIQTNGASAILIDTGQNVQLTGDVDIDGVMGFGAGSSALNNINVNATLVDGTASSQAGISVTTTTETTGAVSGVIIAPILTASTALGAYRGVKVSDINKLSGATVTVARGLEVGDITSGSTSNHAILTGAGLVEFGDDVDITEGTLTVTNTTATSGVVIRDTSAAGGSHGLDVDQAGTARAAILTRNVSAAVRDVVTISQLSTSGGDNAVLHLQQADIDEVAFEVSTDGGTATFAVMASGDAIIGISDAPTIFLNANTDTDPTINFQEAGQTFATIKVDTSGSDISITNHVDGPSAGLFLQTRGGGKSWAFDGSGDLTTPGAIIIPTTYKLYFDGGGDTHITESSTDVMAFTAGNVNMLNITAASVGIPAGNLGLTSGDLTLSEGKVTITDTANETALSVTSSATTANVLDVVANSLTTGRAAIFSSDSSSGSTRDIVQIINNHVSADAATVLHLKQDGDHRALFIDQNGTGNAIYIDSESTTAHAIDTDCDALTTGGIFRGESNSNDTGTRSLLFMRNNHASAVNATVATFHQDSTEHNVFIDTNGDARSISIDSEATTAHTVRIDAASTTGRGLHVAADSLTTGNVAFFYSNSSDSGNARNVVHVVQDHASAANAIALKVQQDSIAAAILIDQNGDGSALEITTTATTSNGIDITSSTITTGANIAVSESSLTTGNLINLYSNSGDVGTRNLVQFQNDNSAATGATVVFIKQDAAQRALTVAMNGNSNAIDIQCAGITTGGAAIKVTSPGHTSADIINIISADALTTGAIARFISNSSDANGRSLLRVWNNHTSATGAVVADFRQDAATNCLFIDQNGDGRAITIDSEATSEANIYIDTPMTTTGAAGMHIAAANSLTTGYLMNLNSNSADVSSRTLVNIVNDNTLATGATPLLIVQDAAQRAMHIDQNGNGNSLTIDSESTNQSVILIDGATTSGNGIRINEDSLTQGKVAFLRSNSADVTSRDLVTIENANALATSARVLELIQNSTSANLFLDTNGNATSISVSSSASTAIVLDINADSTTGNVIDIVANGLTSASGLSIYSNSASTTSRDIAHLRQDHADASNTKVLKLTQDASNDALYIDQNGNGNAIEIVSDATTSSTILVTTAATQGKGLNITADSLTTGWAARFYSNSASASTRNLLEVINDNTAAVSTNVLNIQQDSTGTGIFIDQNGNGVALNIDTQATSAATISVQSATNTSGNIIDIAFASSLTTGSLAYFHSNSADASARKLVDIHNDSSAAVNTQCLVLTQDAASTVLAIQQNANGNAITVLGTGNTSAELINIDGSNTTANMIDAKGDSLTSGDALYVQANALTSGSLASLYSNSGSTTTRHLLHVVQDNTAAVNATPCVLQQDAVNQVLLLDQNAASSFIDYQGTASANTTDPISLHATPGTVQEWLQIEVNGTKRWVAAYSDPSA